MDNAQLLQQRKKLEMQRRSGVGGSVADHLNVGYSQLQQLEDIGLQAQSPVMKKLNALPVNAGARLTEEQMKSAHRLAEIKMPTTSYKQSRRISRMNKKIEWQGRLATAQTTAAAVVKAQHTPETVLKFFSLENLENLLSENADELDGAGFAEKYVELHKKFLYIPELETAVANLMKPNMSAEEQKAYNEAAAMLRTVKDLHARFKIQEAITSNRYYALLPRDDMLALSYTQLRARLEKLYKAGEGVDSTGQPKKVNKELIDYYQNLIRLKTLGLDTEKDVKKRQQKYLDGLDEGEELKDERKGKTVMKDLIKGYKQMKSVFGASDSLHTDEEKDAYYAQYFSTCEKDIIKFGSSVDRNDEDVKEFLEKYNHYRQLDAGAIREETAEQIKRIRTADGEPLKEEKGFTDEKKLTDTELSDRQKEGLRRIQTYLMTLAADTKGEKMPFVHHLLKAPPEQQMMAFYLLENKKQDRPMGSDFYTALYEYKPSVDIFKKNMSWDKLSQAARAAISCRGNIAAYDIVTKRIESSAQRRAAADAAPHHDKGSQEETDRLKEKRDAVIEAMSDHGTMLRLLYRNAGMHEDMPPDMAQDESLRIRLFEEYRAMQELMRELGDLNNELGIVLKASPDYDRDIRPDTEEARPDAEGVSYDQVVSVTERVVMYSGYSTQVDDGIVSLGSVTASLTSSASYGLIFPPLSALFGAADLVVGILQGGQFGMELDTMTGAAKWESVMDFGSSLLTGIGDSVGGTFEFLSALGVIEEASSVAGSVSSWLGDTSEILWNTASTAAEHAAIYCGGAVALGGAVFAASGAVKLGRAWSSRNDVARSRKSVEQAKYFGNSIDTIRLERFLNHQDRTISRTESSAAMTMAMGVATAFAGITTSLGILAPLGGIAGLVAAGLEIGNIIIDKTWKKKNRQKTVDEFLSTDKIVKEVLDSHPNKEELKKDPDGLKLKVRNEVMAQLGFATYKECFRHICQENAKLLYEKVFTDTNITMGERAMYLDAMKSLGLKIRMPGTGPDAKPGEPSVSAMVAKMME